MKRLLFGFLIVLCMAGPVVGAQVLQTLSGVAVSVDIQAQELRVLFEHPVTGEDILKIFKVLPSTGFKNAKRLGDIKPNDPVSVDYEEGSLNQLEAVYVEVVSLQKVPFSKDQLKKKIPFLR